MKCTVKVDSIKSIEEIEGAWSNEDYVQLLDKMSYPEPEKIAANELQDMLFMAITDLEPHEAAVIALTHKLEGDLNEGQIQNIAGEMAEDKVAEEYSDIAMHHELYNVNQLLYKAYNGTFPNTKASLIKLVVGPPSLEISKEVVLKAICNGLGESNLVKRLFGDQLEGKVAFPEAENILWEMEQHGNGSLTLITSDYWLNKEDFKAMEFEGVIEEFEEE